MKRMSDVNMKDEMEIKRASMPKHFTDEKIINFNDLKLKYHLMLSKYLNAWDVKLDQILVFYKLAISDCPAIVASIKIDQNLRVQVFSRNVKVKSKYLEPFLDSNCMLEYWSQLKDLLIYFGSENSLFYNHSITYYLSEAVKNLNCCVENIPTDEDDDENMMQQKLRFLINQLHLTRCKKYTSYTIDLAYSIYIKSSACYKEIQKLGYLTLPSEKELLKFISTNSQESTDDENYSK